MAYFFIFLTLFLFEKEEGREKLYQKLKEEGERSIFIFKKNFPLKEPPYLKIKIISSKDKRVPPWASGIYFERNIYLKEDAIPNLIKTLSHEIAHSLLHETIKERQIPLWFDEGFAQILSGGEENLFFYLIFYFYWGPPLKELEENFPSFYFSKRIAYLKSKILVNKMIKERGKDGFILFLENLKKGYYFEEAFILTFGKNLKSFEKSFKKERLLKIFIFFGSSSAIFWFFLTLLFLYAYILKRKKSKNLLKSMEENDTDVPYF